MTLIIDSNEHSKNPEFYQHLTSTDIKDEVEVMQITLEFEIEDDQTIDVQVFDFMDSNGRFGVERKEVRDFYTSIMDKRLLIQADKIKDFPGMKYLILEGPLDQVFFEHPEQVQLMLATMFLLSEAYDIRIIPTVDKLTTAKALRHCYKKAGSVPVTGLMRRLDKTLARQVQSLCSIPGISKIIAKNALRLFKSISVLSMMNVEQLLLIPKVGEKKANAMYDFFHTMVEIDD